MALRLDEVRRGGRLALEVAETPARGAIVAMVLASMLWLGWKTDPGASAKMADRILSWSFVVFTVGLAELFVLFVVMTVFGRIDLAQAFADKEGSGPGDEPGGPGAGAGGPHATPTPTTTPATEGALPGGAGAGAPTVDGAKPAGTPAALGATPPTPTHGPALRVRPKPPPVSLSRLQAFMWTLVVMTVYFHRVVKDQGNTLPPIPPELLMVMGISGAVYLASKGISKPDGPKPGSGGT